MLINPQKEARMEKVNIWEKLSEAETVEELMPWVKQAMNEFDQYCEDNDITSFQYELMNLLFACRRMIYEVERGGTGGDSVKKCEA